MTPAADHGPVTQIPCAGCGSDVLRPDDHGVVYYWAGTAGEWLMAHAACLSPHEDALSALHPSSS